MELEKAHLGWSSDRLTFAAVACAIYLPLRVWIGWSDSQKVTDSTLEEVQPQRRTESARASAILTGGISALVVVVSGWVYWNAAQTGGLRRVSVADFAAGRVGQRSFVEFDADTGREALRRHRTFGDDTLYVPVPAAPMVVAIDCERHPRSAAI